MRSSSQHQDDAMDFISRAFTQDGPSDQYLAAAQVQATLAVAAALTELAAVLVDN